MPRPATPRPTLDERYELVRSIGSGGMAEVVEAYDHRLGRSVAIKQLRTDLTDPHARERFHHEAMAAAGLTHPNIVSVYDVGDLDGAPYIVMELVDGESLAARLAADGALDPATAVAITAQLLAALEAAHTRGLVHRDVKPGNVLLARDRTVKLADFGIAKALASTGSMTQTGQVLGTPRYLSPEQAAGAPATPRSDLYAAGLVLYEMLAGTAPFAADSPAALVAAHQHAPVPPITDTAPGLAPGVVQTLDRALAKDPAERFASAAAMARSLQNSEDTTVADVAASTQVLPAEPGSTRDPTADAPPRRDDRRATGRRRGVAFLALAGCLVLAIAGLALLGADNKVPSETQAATPTTSSAAAVAPAPATTAPTLPPTTLPPQTVAELIALLSNDPEGFGSAGPLLLERLQKIEENPERAGREASKTLDQLERWVDHDDISPTLAALATQILTPLADSDGDGKGDGSDRGPGRDFSDDDSDDDD